MASVLASMGLRELLDLVEALLSQINCFVLDREYFNNMTDFEQQGKLMLMKFYLLLLSGIDNGQHVKEKFKMYHRIVRNSFRLIRTERVYTFPPSSNEENQYETDGSINLFGPFIENWVGLIEEDGSQAENQDHPPPNDDEPRVDEVQISGQDSPTPMDPIDESTPIFENLDNPQSRRKRNQHVVDEDPIAGSSTGNNPSAGASRPKRNRTVHPRYL